MPNELARRHCEAEGAGGKGDSPEFGMRQFPTVAIQVEAADMIDTLERELAAVAVERDALKDQLKLAQQWRTGYEQCKAEAKALRVDAARLDWFEAQHTLHKSVEVLYVVDGYDLMLCYDSNPQKEFRGDTLRAAIDAAMSGGKK